MLHTFKAKSRFFLPSSPAKAIFAPSFTSTRHCLFPKLHSHTQQQLLVEQHKKKHTSVERRSTDIVSSTGGVLHKSNVKLITDLGNGHPRSSSVVRGVHNLSTQRIQKRGFSSNQSLFSSDADGSNGFDVEKVRNIAIIAHVDVGKTTLVDCLLKQTNTLKSENEDRVMDSMQLEKERGITIMSKITSVKWKEYTLNIVDTPGHADFGGEVERIMSMVDGVCLLVDASDGPMTQTRFVLSKALGHGLRPLVVINKVDRDTARIGGEVEEEILDLFIGLDASDAQCEYPVLYASARDGWAVRNMKDKRESMEPLFETIINYFSSPKIDKDLPFRMLATNLEYDRHFGRVMTGKIHSGQVKLGDKIKSITRTGELVETGKVMHLLSRRGLEKYKVNEAFAGELISVAGLNKVGVTDTICSVTCSNDQYIDTQPIDPPIISIYFYPNDSPIAGKDGQKCSNVQLRDRLLKEAETNIGIQIKQSGEIFEVMGRGEMQIGILVETMRREGYEFQIGCPQVIFKKDENGNVMEPIEELILDIDNNDMSLIMEKMGKRGAEVTESKVQGSRTKLTYLIPTRHLIGFSSEFKTDTRGQGVLSHVFHSYQSMWPNIDKLRKGCLISMGTGLSTAYALNSVEKSGVLFIKPQQDIYEGMIVGENSRDGDLEVNPCKEKHLTNMRASGKEEAIRLAPIRQFQIEEALTYILPDELIEVTPKNIRLRKKTLNSVERKKESRNKAK